MREIETEILPTDSRSHQRKEIRVVSANVREQGNVRLCGPQRRIISTIESPWTAMLQEDWLGQEAQAQAKASA